MSDIGLNVAFQTLDIGIIMFLFYLFLYLIVILFLGFI